MMHALRRGFPAVVALVALVTFLPAMRNDFLDFDDLRNFLQNPNYRGLGWAQLKWMFSTAHMGHYIPLTWVTLGLDYRLWGMNPAGYHLTNVVLHAMAGALFYFVARRLIGAANGQCGVWTTDAAALVAALVFAIHPLRVESVAWVSERRDVLSGVFYMATLLAWFRATEREPVTRRWYWVSVALFVCALLSKVIVLTLPAVLLILDVYPLRRLGGERGWWNRHARSVYQEKVPFAVIAACSALLAVVAVRSTISNMAPLSRLGVAGRAAISAFGLVFYGWKTVLPINLSPLYPLVLPLDPLEPRYLLAAAVVVLISALAIALRHRAPVFGWAWAAYVIMLLPVIGIAQNGPQIAADRYTYLACLPWALIVGGAAAAAFRRASTVSREAVLGGALVVVGLVIILQTLTVNQIRVWHDPLTLWRHAVHVDVSNGIAYNNLAAALWRGGSHDEAIDAYEKAVLRLRSEIPEVRAGILFSLAILLQDRGDLAAAEARYREALALQPRHAGAWNNLGAVLAKRGQYDKAFVAFREALTIAPGEPDTCANARRVSAILGRSLKELERCLTPATI
jgi:protein O-mannosyl-transferase